MTYDFLHRHLRREERYIVTQMRIPKKEKQSKLPKSNIARARSKMALCGHCGKPVHSDDYPEHLRSVHHIVPKSKALNSKSNVEKFRDPEFGGQTRYEGGFRWVQGGGPGSKQR